MNAESLIVDHNSIEHPEIKDRILEVIQEEIRLGNNNIIVTAGHIEDRKGNDSVFGLGESGAYRSELDPFILNISLRLESWESSYEEMRSLDEVAEKILTEEERERNLKIVEQKKRELEAAQAALAQAERNLKK